jgi:ABC-2 type transport system ATP-binding protein
LDALTIDGVVKRFGDFTAVANLSFSVGQGEVFGFLGGNGAGKTTTLRMVLDILRPDAGSITVLGHAPGLGRAAQIGFLPEERGLYRAMSAIDTIIFFGRLKGMTAADARREGLALLERFGLAANAKSRVDQLSKGMSQKVQLATAVVNKPSLLILDEPFSGLDPLNQGLLEDEIRMAARGGATVIFSTHVMQHAERLCDRLLLLARGVKRFEGTQAEARATLPQRLTLVSRQSPEGRPGVAAASALDAPVDGWQSWDVRLQPGHSADDLLEQLSAQGFALRRFEQQRASLHDIFVHIVGAPAEPSPGAPS